MTTRRWNSERFRITCSDNLTEFVEMQNSNPAFAVRFSWECACGALGTARTEVQAEQALVAHKDLRKEG